jgi:hypothetical protein
MAAWDQVGASINAWRAMPAGGMQQNTHSAGSMFIDLIAQIRKSLILPAWISTPLPTVGPLLFAGVSLTWKSQYHETWRHFSVLLHLGRR